MEKLYTVGWYKVYSETVGYNTFEFDNVNVNGEMMKVYFCKNEKGMFVIAGKYRKGAAYRSCGHWHSGRGYIDVYFRKNFRTREEGNEFYKKVKNTRAI